MRWTGACTYSSTMKILTKLCVKYTYNFEDDDPWSQKLPVVDPKYNRDR